MPVLKINKIDAAKRLLCSAIDMHFKEGDPCSINLLSSSAFQILRDIAKQSGGVAAYEDLKKAIKPGKERKLWDAFNKVANYLKHADEDANEELDFNDEANDHLIQMAIIYYQSLAHELTPEMAAYQGWIIVMYSEMLIKLDQFKPVIVNLMPPENFKTLYRSKKIKYGNDLLQLAIQSRHLFA